MDDETVKSFEKIISERWTKQIDSYHSLSLGILTHFTKKSPYLNLQKFKSQTCRTLEPLETMPYHQVQGPIIRQRLHKLFLTSGYRKERKKKKNKLLTIFEVLCSLLCYCWQQLNLLHSYFLQFGGDCICMCLKFTLHQNCIFSTKKKIYVAWVIQSVSINLLS